MGVVRRGYNVGGNGMDKSVAGSAGNCFAWSAVFEGPWADAIIAGSFRAPPPGHPVSEPYNDKELALGTKVEDLNDPVARKNFRVVIIKPEEVEATDLSDPAKARRHRYTYVGKEGEEWKTEELWP